MCDELWSVHGHGRMDYGHEHEQMDDGHEHEQMDMNINGQGWTNEHEMDINGRVCAKQHIHELKWA